MCVLMNALPVEENTWSLEYLLGTWHSSLTMQPFKLNAYNKSTPGLCNLALIEITKINIPEQYFTSGDLVNIIRNGSKKCYDVMGLRKIAFTQVKLPKRKHLATRRAFYVKQLINETRRDSVSESRGKWLRRRSLELLHFSVEQESSFNFVMSCNRSTVATFNGSLNKGNIEVQIVGNRWRKTISLSAKRRQKNLTLIGVSNDGENLIFCHQSAKRNFTRVNEEISVSTISVPYAVVAGFYCENSDEIYIIGIEGVVTKLKLNDASKMETINVYNKRAKVTTAAFDCKQNLLWMHLNATAVIKPQLLVVDTASLDVFNVIELGSEAVNRICCSLNSAYVCGQSMDGCSTVSFVNSSLCKQIISENERIVDTRVYTMLDNANIASINMPNVVIVLFKSGKLLWIETEGSCVQRKHCTFIDENIEKSAFIVNAFKEKQKRTVTILIASFCNIFVNKTF
ncbi:hypothetical protein B4U79_07775 [Dinothrombium tinctorium]|uniref:Uncharacterized protein n=1 Tax=Dinothrombium tinctorium TaxID=1965070 RepID=A0A3S3QUI3_9ACAR|nr:hypothetical protein B4U79_12812 [Dinothrombium tinctorium]RWS14193.1 hypothetical protein B4U79_00804 [Dinothrombium tinctorium]RWS14705.1 hypothetical protein B4U79_07775 [Dinothrombium tinctorium]